MANKAGRSTNEGVADAAGQSKQPTEKDELEDKTEMGIERATPVPPSLSNAVARDPITAVDPAHGRGGTGTESSWVLLDGSTRILALGNLLASHSCVLEGGKVRTQVLVGDCGGLGARHDYLDASRSFK